MQGLWSRRFVLSEQQSCPVAHISPEDPEGQPTIGYSGRVVAISPLRSHLPKRVGGGPRGDIRCWSAASRRRLLLFMGALPLDAIQKENGGRFAFVTLTYRDDPGPVEVKRHLDAFLKACRRRGVTSWVWKMEFQERGVPHYHLLLELPKDSAGCLRAFRSFSWSTWERITGHRHRVDVDWCRARDVARYIAFDQTKWAKSYQYRVPASWSSVGRWWGYSGLRPRWVGRRVSERELIAARRILRRHRCANSSYKCRFGQGRSANGRMWALGTTEGALGADLERWLAGLNP